MMASGLLSGLWEDLTKQAEADVFENEEVKSAESIGELIAENIFDLGKEAALPVKTMVGAGLAAVGAAGAAGGYAAGKSTGKADERARIRNIIKQRRIAQVRSRLYQMLARRQQASGGPAQ